MNKLKAASVIFFVAVMYLFVAVMFVRAGVETTKQFMETAIYLGILSEGSYAFYIAFFVTLAIEIAALHFAVSFLYGGDEE